MVHRSPTPNARWLAALIAVTVVVPSCSGDDAASDEAATEVGSDITATELSVAAQTTQTSAAASAPTEVASTESSVGASTTAAETVDGDGLTPTPEGVDLDAEIVMAYSWPPQTLDPVLSLAASDDTYLYMMYDRLTDIGPDLEVLPYLATAWSYGADGTSFTMQLRDDATFHDGTPFNAEAVVANINRSLTLEDSANAARLTGVAGVEATGPYEVTFSTPNGEPGNLPVLLAGRPGMMVSPTFIANPTIDLRLEIGPVGSGPYMPTEYRPGQGVTYERAPSYWDPGHQLAATFQIDLVAPSARINGVRDGTFDLSVAPAIDAAWVIELAESGAFNAYPKVLNTVFGALFNPGIEGPLANHKFRQAIMYAMDRDAISQGLFEGRCEPRWQSFPEGNKYFFPEIEHRYPFDQDMARRLIQESGVSDPTFDIHAAPGAYEPFAQVMQAQLAEVGITMNIVPGDIAAIPANFVIGASAAILLVVYAQPDPASLYANWFGGVFGNLLNPTVPEAAAIRTAAEAINNASITEAEQLAAWQRVYTDIQELAVFAPSCAPPQVWLSQPSIIGVADMPFIWAGGVAPYTIGMLAG